MHKATKIMRQLQELQFAATEVRLYLDTHPYDRAAQQQYQQLTYQIMLITPKVEKYFGPLKFLSFSRENPSRWITDPWPWEMMSE